MDSTLTIEQYNYDVFTSSKYLPLMRFDQSPPLGESAPDFPLWTLDEEETTLSAIWGSNLFTVVEFGSFT